MGISKELPKFEVYGLEVYVNGQERNRELSRKIAMLKILLRKPPIVLVKDTPWIVGRR